MAISFGIVRGISSDKYLQYRKIPESISNRIDRQTVHVLQICFRALGSACWHSCCLLLTVDILFQKLKGYEAKIIVATSEGNGDAMG